MLTRIQYVPGIESTACYTRYLGHHKFNLLGIPAVQKYTQTTYQHTLKTVVIKA